MTFPLNYEPRTEREAVALVAWHALLQRTDRTPPRVAMEAFMLADLFLRERKAWEDTP